MTTLPTRTKNTGAGSAEWVALLSQCIDSIGAESFPGALVDTLKSLADFDNSVVFAYHQSEKPLCLFHTFSPEKRTVYVDDYLKGPYLLDPFFKACSRQIDPAMAAKIHKVSDTEFNVERSVVDDILENQAQMVERVGGLGIQPHGVLEAAPGLLEPAEGGS